MSKLSTESIKSFLEKITKIPASNFKRDSKLKNDNKEVMRIFSDSTTTKNIHVPAKSEILSSRGGFVLIAESDEDNYTESTTYTVISDSKDEKIVCVLKDDEDNDETEIWKDENYYSNQTKLFLSKAQDYIFIISGDLLDKSSKEFYVGFTTPEKFKKFKGNAVYLECPEALSDRDFNTLTNILDLPNKLGLSFVTLAEPPIFEFCILDGDDDGKKQESITRKDVYDLLISMGFKYSSSLAKASNKAADGEWDIKNWVVSF